MLAAPSQSYIGNELFIISRSFFFFGYPAWESYYYELMSSSLPRTGGTNCKCWTSSSINMNLFGHKLIILVKAHRLISSPNQRHIVGYAIFSLVFFVLAHQLSLPTQLVWLASSACQVSTPAKLISSAIQLSSPSQLVS